MPLLNTELPVIEEFSHISEVSFADEASAQKQINAWYAAKKINYAEPNFKRSSQH